MKTIVYIDSSEYPEQSSSDLTVHLNTEIQNTCNVCLTYACIPCTFYNISEAKKNNKLMVKGFSVSVIMIPDGLYDLESFAKTFADKLKENSFSRNAVKFDVEEHTGKAVLKMLKRRNDDHHQIMFQGKSNELFGLKPDQAYPSVEDIATKDTIVSENPINFRPMNYFVIHCDIINSSHNLKNGEPSDILDIKPIKEANIGDMLTYSTSDNIDIPCKSKISKLGIRLTDENNEIIDLNGFDVQYQLTFT